MKLAIFSTDIPPTEKYSDIKFNENLSRGSRVFSRGLADMTKLTVSFRNFCEGAERRYFF
jgi:hypothetical protein